MKVISLLNMKGGVAKSFTAVNMAYELWRRGYKVLLWDNDKQGNLSRAYKRYDAESIAPVSKILEEEWNNPEDLIQDTEYDGIEIVVFPDMDERNKEMDLNVKNRRKLFEEFSGSVDRIIDEKAEKLDM